MTRSILFLVGLSVLAAPAAAQIIPTSTVFFFTAEDATDWDNVVLEHNGTFHTVTFDLVPLGTSGVYGPQFDEQAYVLEAFWSNATSLTAGHDHQNTAGGNPGSWEQHHFQGTDQRQGYRISRVDGLAFNLISLDYRNAVNVLEILTTDYPDATQMIANATTFGNTAGYNLNDPNWGTFVFAQCTTTGNGQAPQPGVATLDVNLARDVCNALVASGNPGPYSATVTPGGTMDFTFEGEANQGIIVLFGTLNVGAASFPGIGQLDIGAIDPASGLPIGISVLANGTIPSGINVFFNTGISGTSFVSLPVPSIPPGLLTTFQCLIFNSVTIAGLTNVVEITVM